MLGIRGQVLPVSHTDTHLCARLTDGTVIKGEDRIDIREEKPDVPVDYVYLDPPAVANELAVEAIRTADGIVIAPGDLYTSIIPNLLVDGIPEAIAASRARKIYVSNLMTKHGETDGFRASDFIREVKRYLGSDTVLDCAIVNSEQLPQQQLDMYQAEGAHPVGADIAACGQLVDTVVPLPLAAAGTLLRHDSDRLARAIIQLLEVAPLWPVMINSTHAEAVAAF